MNKSPDILSEYYNDFSHQEDSSRRVGWCSKAGQRLRFEVLLDAIDPRDFPLSVLDVGCGEGALYGYLRETGRLGEYLGLDILPSMVEGAKRRYTDGDFQVGDLLQRSVEESFDLVFCSGSLNVKVKRHSIWVQKMLDAMWKRARLALVVNFQTTRAYRFDPGAKHNHDIMYHDKATLLGWCERLTPWVTLRQDYIGSDLSIYLYRNYHRSCRQMEEHHEASSLSEMGPCEAAYLLLMRSLPEKALEILEKASPTASTHNFKGLCYHNLGQFEQARDAYREALNLEPDLEEARINLKLVLEKL
jgi:SAM-dependent methyltransferase